MVNKTLKFAFIVHPLDLEDLHKLSGQRVLFPKEFNKFQQKNFLKFLPPLELMHVRTFDSSLQKEINGLGILCPLLPSQLVAENKRMVFDKIYQSIKLAEKNGAEIVGLGGFTSIVTSQGADFDGLVDCAITSGNTYTSVLVMEGIEKAACQLGLPLQQARLCIIGATGNIGGACCRFFSKKVKGIALIARDIERLRLLANELAQDSQCEIEISTVFSGRYPKYDIFIVSSSATISLLDVKFLKPHTIVSDVSIPPGVVRETVSSRKDVFVFEGGRAKVPFYDDFKQTIFGSIFPKNSIFGCLAETMVLALENRKENFSFGQSEISGEKIDEMRLMAERNKFFLSDFFYDNQPINISGKI